MNIINYIVGAIAVTTGVFLSVKNFSNSKVNIKQFLIHFLIMFPLVVITNLYINGVLKIVCSITYITIALYFSMFNKSISNAIYYTLVNELFAFIVEILLSIIFVSIFNFNLDNYNNNFSLSLCIFTVLNSIIVYIISKNKSLNTYVQKFNYVIMKRKNEMIYAIIVILFLSALLTFNGFNLEKDLSFYINFGMTIFVFVTLIYMIFSSLKSYKLENQYNEMMEYVVKYENIINEQGKKNHEYNNQLMVIKGYADNPKKLEEYLNLIIDEHKCGQNYTIRQLSSFPNGGIKGLMYHKLSKMDEKNIKYYLYIDKNIKDIFEKKLTVKTYQDITKLLGVFLDNAIEASMDAELKEIEFEMKKQDDCIIITISNTYNNGADIGQVGKKGFTTKGIGHGYGLSIVKDISKNNDNIETFSDQEDNKFKQTIILYYK